MVRKNRVESRRDGAFAGRIGVQVEAASIGMIIVLGLMVLMALHGRPAHGQEDETASTAVRVPYRAADIGDLPHARHFLRVLEHAALQACGDETASLGDIRAAVEWSDCRRASVARAVAQVHSPLLERAWTEDGAAWDARRAVEDRKSKHG
ncbi:UrcA family protein [Nguyenibacter vanlangensis]|uniref:UrcA family protein n=2 Tax=Nguyenibacter vanlangensis TaxID=1216886 RepID=A0A7Y7IY62_9PROT|nr:UrcA family protein [Nguyenibacter vanlangensis]